MPEEGNVHAGQKRDRDVGLAKCGGGEAKRGTRLGANGIRVDDRAKIGKHCWISTLGRRDIEHTPERRLRVRVAVGIHLSAYERVECVEGLVKAGVRGNHAEKWVPRSIKRAACTEPEYCTRVLAVGVPVRLRAPPQFLVDNSNKDVFETQKKIVCRDLRLHRCRRKMRVLRKPQEVSRGACGRAMTLGREEEEDGMWKSRLHQLR
jgi:hypothetical protein